MASKEKTPSPNAAATSDSTNEPTPSSSAAAADTGAGEAPASAKPKVCRYSTDPLLFLFRLLSFFPSLCDTYYDSTHSTDT